MNEQQHRQYLASQQAHMSDSQSYASQSSPAGGMSQYSHYPHQQPPVLQPATHAYAPPQSSYGSQYGYGTAMPSSHGSGQPVSSSSMAAQHMHSGLPPLPTMTASGSHTYVGTSTGPQAAYQQPGADQTGQVAPAGMKPRVTATLWEDEGCMCFQIEAKGICVARRDDNHMINGTKLLNVAGMTRGRRDGILKSEKNRTVVKIGPMHLKGVWIPFDRALDFANKEKITELLYPLFVHNIGALLYHPTNSSRTNAVMAAADRRRLDNTKQPGGMVGPTGPQPPSLTHHHTMNSSTVGSQPSGSVASQSAAGRPGIDRAHTFPTPPTSASGQVGMGSQGSPYDGWPSGGMGAGVQGQQYDNHTQSTPATPATTPPGSSLPSLQPYQGHQSYDNSRPMYPASTAQQSQYATSLQNQAMARNSSLQSHAYSKQEMGPPTALNGSKTEADHGDQKLTSYMPSHTNEHAGEEEAEHEQDSEFGHEHKYAYDTHRNSYSGINGHQNGSGHVTPMTTATSQSMWAGGYQSSPRVPTAPTLYNPTSDTRGAMPSGTISSDGHVPNAYAPTQTNGLNKRQRDDDDPYAKTDDVDALKRRKMSTAGMTNGVLESERPLNRVKSSNTPRLRR